METSASVTHSISLEMEEMAEIQQAFYRNKIKVVLKAKKENLNSRKVLVLTLNSSSIVGVGT